MVFIRVIYYFFGDVNFNFEIHFVVDIEDDIGLINKMILDKLIRWDWII